jgi:hypothetical protein
VAGARDVAKIELAALVLAESGLVEDAARNCTRAVNSGESAATLAPAKTYTRHPFHAVARVARKTAKVIRKVINPEASETPEWLTVSMGTTVETSLG